MALSCSKRFRGAEPEDPTTRLAPAITSGAWQTLRAEGMQVAVMREEDFPLPLDAESQDAYDRAKEALASLGVKLVPADLPFSFNDMTERNGRIIAAESYAVHREYIHDQSIPIGPYVRQRVLAGADISANDYIETLADHRRMKAVYAEFMKPFDALLTPSLPFPAIPVAEVDEAAVPLAAYGRPANYLGACGLALPAGFTATGLPLSVQLMGAAFAEEPLLALGAALEPTLSTTERKPDLTAV
ncbi:amidase family protein [Nitratireductor sp. GISD-1A_MAKvit]|uniref:amidase family protein n=1 Tax=Nitratireductor sp. GISD-1A_MAKvit TaxID=3234198 RepID=UPI003467BF6D